MVERIKISTTEFKVSRPGVNVNTAGANDLIFNALTTASYAGVILKGTSSTSDWSPAFATSPPVVPVGNNWFFNPFQTFRRMRQISFPEQTVRPDVIFMVRPLGDPSWATPHYSFLTDFGSSTPASNLTDTSGRRYYFPDSWAGTSAWASTSTNTLTLRLDYVAFSAGALNWEFSYVVFQPPKRFLNNAWQDLPGLIPG